MQCLHMQLTSCLFPQRPVIHQLSSLIEQHPQYLIKCLRMLLHHRPNRLHSNLRRLLNGIGIHARGDGRKGHAADAILHGKFQRMPIAASQQFCLTMITPMPDWPYRVNHIFAWKPVCLGDFRLTCSATMQRPTLRQQFRPGGSVYGSIHTTAPKQALIGSVDNGFGIMPCRDVSKFCSYDGYAAYLSLWLISAGANTPAHLSALPLSAAPRI